LLFDAHAVDVRAVGRAQIDDLVAAAETLDPRVLAADRVSIEDQPRSRAAPDIDRCVTEHQAMP
jgi:hypothetical protein